MKRPRLMGAPRALTGMLAVAFGLLGWLVAHGLTYRLLEQHRHDVVDVGVPQHGHSYLGALGWVAAGMALASLLAMFLVGRRRPEDADRLLHSGRALRRKARVASALSTAGFVLAELVEHAVVGDHQVPPVTVLLVGVVLQMLVATVTCALWRSCVRLSQRTTARRTRCAVAESATVVHAVAELVDATQWWFSDRAGRAPPAAAATARPTFV